MNNKISYTITIVLSIFVIGLALLFQKNKKQLESCAKQLNHIQSYISHIKDIDTIALLQYEYDQIQVDTGLVLINSYGKEKQLSNLYKSGTLVFRFFTETCLNCYDKNIKLLNRINRQKTIPLLILTNANSISNLKKLEHLLQVSRGTIFMIKAQEEDFLDIDSFAKPYYSWINSSGVTSHFFFVRQGNPDLTKSYLTIIANKQIKAKLN